MRPLSRHHMGTGAGQNQARQRPCTGWLNLLAFTLPLTARLSALLLTLGVAVVGAPHVRADSVDEARLQAAFVAKFPAFVQWPASAFSDRGALTICVCRSERAAAYLRELVAGEQVGGRPLTVRAVDTAPQLRGCHVLFVPEPAGVPGPASQRASQTPTQKSSWRNSGAEHGGACVCCCASAVAHAAAPSAIAAVKRLRMSFTRLSKRQASRIGARRRRWRDG